MHKIWNLTIVYFSLLICVLYGCSPTELSEKPQIQAGTINIPKSNSEIKFPLTITFSLLNDAINRHIPSRYSESGNGGDVCGKIDLGIYKQKICAGTKYSYTVRPTSGFEISKASNDTLKASIGIKIDGKGGFRGDGARLLALDNKSFDGQLNLHALLTFRFSGEWCPIVDGKIDYTWRRGPRIEIVDNVYINVRNEVDSKLRPEMNKAMDQIKQGMPCNEIEKALSNIWKNYSIPIPIPETGTTFYANFTPNEAGTSGLIVRNQDVRFIVGIRGISEISNESIDQTINKPLPKRNNYDDQPGYINLYLPIRFNYGELQKALADEIVDKDFKFNGKQEGTIRINEISLYPHGEHIVIGLKFKADPLGGWFPAKGEVFILGKPSINTEKKEIYLTDIKYARILDSKLWSLLSTIFQSTIKEEIGKFARIKYDKTVEDLKQSIRDSMTDIEKNTDLKLILNELSIEPEKIVPEQETLSALILIKANVEGRVVSLQNL